MKMFIRAFFFSILFPVLLLSASYSCPGQNVASVNGATTDAHKGYHSDKRKINGKRYFKFKTRVDGSITISFDNAHTATFDYKQRLGVGTSCDQHQIYLGSDGTSDSTTFNVTAGTWYYVYVEERNAFSKLKFDIDFDFTKESTKWVRNAAHTEAHTAPSPYNNNLNITSSLDISGASRLSVHVTGETERDSSCRYDYVRITDEAGADHTFCGNSIDETFDVNGSSVDLLLHSNSSVIKDGVTVTITEIANQPPVASATVSPASGPEGTTFTFDGSGSTDDGGIRSYTWSEGGTSLGSGATFTKNDFTIGTHTVTLTVIDVEGLSDTEYVTITVTANQPPVAVTGPDQNILSDENATMDGSGSSDDGGILSYSWAVNGHTYTGVNAIIPGSDLASGDNTVTLTVSDAAGLTNTDTMIIHIMEVVENADDLCYEEVQTSGACMDMMGICKAGFGCKHTYPLKNIGDSNLTNTSVIHDESGGVGMSMGDDCGVDPSGSCNKETDYQMGPMTGGFTHATVFDLDDPIEPDSSGDDFWSTTTGMSCFGGNGLYATYVKDGKLHRGELRSCDNPPPDCSKPHPFEERVNKIINGDLVAIGNSNICADTDRDGICDADQHVRNDRHNIIFINAASSTPVAGESSDLNNTSAAQLQLPDGAVIKWAGLYWQGQIWDFNTANTRRVNNGIAIENGEDGQNRKDAANTIKFKMPGGSYQDLTADEHYYVYVKRKTKHNHGDYTGITRYEEHYQSFKDVTTLLKGLADPNGNYWVANIQATVGKLDYPGVEAAWSLQIIYAYPDADLKNIAINDGYVALYDNASAGDDYANAVGCPTGSANTGAYGRSIEFDVNGFLTPKTAGFDTDLSLFITESDPEDSSTTEKLTITKRTGGTHLVDGPNAWNYEITDKNGSDNLNRTPHYIYPIGMTIKNYRMTDGLDPNQVSTHVKFQTDSDRLLIGVIGFSTKLRAPDLCYDYAYQQDGRYFTEENDGSKAPEIVGSLYSLNPVNVSLFVKNQENSDVTIKNMKTTIDPIDTAQASYINNTVKVIPPGETQRQSATPGSSSASSIVDVPIGNGDVGGKEFFYLYYDLNPREHTVSMPINAFLDYDTTFTLPDGSSITLPSYHQKLDQDIPLCADGNFSYDPVYGMFNVEEKNLGKYNIYSQVTRRVDPFEVIAYDANNLDTRINASTMVAVELIDAGAFHETQTSCQEPDSALSPRIWVTFDNNVTHTDFTAAVIQDAIANGLVSDQILHKSSQIDEPEDVYSKARENAAFRISAIQAGSAGDMIQLEPKACQGGQVAPCYRVTNFPDLHTLDAGNGQGNCVQDVDGNPANTDKIEDFCDVNTSKNELAQCMECLYGYNMAYICSRDNFAIRPEAFKVSLSDDNASTSNNNFANNTNRTGSAGAPVNLIAGYPYRFDINATNYTDETPATGYAQSLDSNDTRKRAYLQWTPSSGRDVSNCNEPADRNMSFYLVNGTNTNPNPLNTWEDRHDASTNVGEYTFKVIDQEWTKYDWDTNLTQHHNGNSHFISNSTPDCIEDDSSSPAPGNKIGCEISSIHTGTAVYSPIHIRTHPYRFDLSHLIIGARAGTDTASDTFVYINTLDPTHDDNMSYNVQGLFRAVSYDANKSLNNFVNKCYAENVDMLLNYNYIVAQPANSMRYDLYDSNVTGFTRANALIASNNVIVQPAANFSKELNGSISMDLGYNFDRAYNTPQNPIYVQMHDFNISYSTPPSPLFVEGINHHTISGTVNIDKNVSFVYGRAKPNKFFYDDITTTSTATPVSIVVYCDLNTTGCQQRGLNTVTSGLITDAQSNEPTWYFSQQHDVSLGDGDITLNATAGTVNPIDPTAVNPSQGIDSTVTVSNTGGNTPHIVNIDLGSVSTNKWLIYNKDANQIPSPFYRVRFIGAGGWTGKGKTGHVVGDDINNKKTRRTEW